MLVDYDPSCNRRAPRYRTRNRYRANGICAESSRQLRHFFYVRRSAPRRTNFLTYSRYFAAEGASGGRESASSSSARSRCHYSNDDKSDTPGHRYSFARSIIRKIPRDSRLFQRGIHPAASRLDGAERYTRNALPREEEKTNASQRNLLRAAASNERIMAGSYERKKTAGEAKKNETTGKQRGSDGGRRGKG